MTSPLLYHYRADCRRAIDGDTLEVIIDLGFGMTRKERIRLLGIDCPEANTPEGRAARLFAIDWLNAAQVATESVWELMLHTSKGDSFGRWLAQVEDCRGRNLTADLIAAGHAKKKEV